RRVFQSAAGKPVVLTIGVPQQVPGSDCGCPLQITGLNTRWRRPRYVFGIDGFQALHLAMKCADAALESAAPKLAWLGQKSDLGMPKFLPELPKPHRDRLEALMAREAIKLWRQARRPRRKSAKDAKGRMHKNAADKR